MRSQKQKARIEIQACLNPIFYEKPYTRCMVVIKGCMPRKNYFHFAEKFFIKASGLVVSLMRSP
jgi:hypothetical protein